MSARRVSLRGATAGVAVFLAGLTAHAGPAAERELTFGELWGKVKSHAPALRASGQELEAARTQEARLSRHWYPRIYADARAYSTNDPALSFMSILGQRQITASDFAPGALNQPGSHLFGQATLGIDLPVYEGGARVAAHQSAGKAVAAKDAEGKAAALASYAGLGNAYASLLVLGRERLELEKLSRNLDEILRRYKIGSRSNPVGYSGLLGLKNLRNRLEGLLIENGAKEKAARDAIHFLSGDLPPGWVPKDDSPDAFISEHFPKGQGQSASVQAARASAEASAALEPVEKARFLPRVGLFAEGNLYDGNRATATSYTGGAYLQWDLFSASNFGAVEEAEHRTAAAQARADSLNESSEIERSRAEARIDALGKSVKLMNESLPLLSEQTDVAQGLFRSGSINALQLVEVLSRRADLLSSRATAQLSLLEAHIIAFLSSDPGEVAHVIE